MAYYHSINKMCEHSSVVEHHVANVMVVGSSPIARSIFPLCEHSSVVEHHVANVMVVGSSPIARSIFLYRFISR